MSAHTLAGRFPGGSVKHGRDYTVDCPACGNNRALTIGKDGTLSCTGAGCSHGFAEALGMSSPEWDALYLAAFPDATKSQSSDVDENAPKTISANDIVEWIEERYRTGRTQDGLTFAVPTSGGSARVAREVVAVRSEVLRRFRDERIASGLKGVVLSSDALKAALEAVSAYAEIKDPEPVALRAAQVGDDRIVLDLGDADGNVVDVTPAGWTVTKMGDTVPMFRRSEATAPLPLPRRGGSMDTLREFLGLDADDPRWFIARGWLVGSLFSERPRPILWATGTQGSGKSTRARMLLSLVEPAEALGKVPGRNERDDDTAARGRYLCSWDNVSTISTATSNWFCTLVTGGTVDRRGLWTNDGLRSSSYRRSGVATSIVLPGGLLPDALERLAIVDFERVPEVDRRPESLLWTEYAASKPDILGALLSDVVAVLRNLEDVIAEGKPMPRMADYAQILLALDRGLGIDDDAGHFAAYKAAVDVSLAERAEDDEFSAAVISAVRARGGHWRGNAETLLGILDRALGFDEEPRRRPPWWPTNGRKTSSELRKASEALRHAGVVVDFGRDKTSRWVDLTDTRSTQHQAAADPF